MKIGNENKKNNSEKIILNTVNKIENKILKNKLIEYQFISHLLGQKFNVDYEDEMITFEDGVTYSFREIREMKKNIPTFDVGIGHLLKDVFKVTYAGKVTVEDDDDE